MNARVVDAGKWHSLAQFAALPAVLTRQWCAPGDGSAAGKVLFPRKSLLVRQLLGVQGGFHKLAALILLV